MNSYIGHSTRTLDVIIQNKNMDIQRSIELRKTKAIKEFNKGGRHFNRDSVSIGDRALDRTPSAIPGPGP